MPAFNKILIANRGEIACRVMRTAIEQAVSYSPNDTTTTLFNTMEQLRTRYNALITSSCNKPGDTTAK